MAGDFPEFDELYVISDLHMGGEPGRQIFRQGTLLGKFIDHLTARDSGLKVGLCINGDTVDFLAEPDASVLDPKGAVKKLRRIIGDPSFKAVWEALGRFVRTANRRLILTLGNHDLELALPWVQDELVRYLADG